MHVLHSWPPVCAAGSTARQQQLASAFTRMQQRMIQVRQLQLSGGLPAMPFNPCMEPAHSTAPSVPITAQVPALEIAAASSMQANASQGSAGDAMRPPTQSAAPYDPVHHMVSTGPCDVLAWPIFSVLSP